MRFLDSRSRPFKRVDRRKNILKMRNTSCLRLCLTIMTVTGVWLPTALKCSHLRYIYYIFAFMYHLLFVLPIIYMEFGVLYQVLGNIEQMANTSLLLVTHIAQCVKICVMWYKQDEIHSLLVTLDSSTFTREDSNKKQILKDVIQTTYTVSKVFISLVVITGIFWGIYPMLKPTLDLPIQYPNIPPEYKIFPFVYLYQIVNLTITAIAIASIDFLVGASMALVSAEMDILSYELSLVGKINKKDDKGNTDIKRDYVIIISCVEFHENIIKFVKDLEKIFGFPVFFQFFTSAIIICETAFRITNSTETIELLAMVLYFMCIITELLMYCYYGDLLKRKSERVVEMAYCCNWENTDVRTQRALLLLMQRAQRTLVLRAGNMFELSMMTFSAILKTSYTYFTVLNERRKA
uniref:Odorant receptor n=1 Tax=Eogystia hippophaecolus TaxID=1206364 RepID=A0A1B3P5S3_EOGHI|nr:odorant receptor [Eogystia hippophaecolus]